MTIKDALMQRRQGRLLAYIVDDYAAINRMGKEEAEREIWQAIMDDYSREQKSPHLREQTRTKAGNQLV